jgi:peptidoglycan hydrolase CwlO-like protein
MTETDCAALVIGDRISIPNMGFYTIVSNNVVSKKITLALDRRVSGEFRLYNNMGDAELYSKSVSDVDNQIKLLTAKVASLDNQVRGLDSQIKLLTTKVASLDKRVDKLETKP